MFSWPRIRIIFAMIGMLSTLYYGYEAIGDGLNLLVEFLGWLETLAA